MKTKKTSFLIFWIIMTFSCQLYSQSKADCNTLFVCIAKDDFDALFSNSFVKDTLFFAKKTPLKQQLTSILGNILWANLPH
jgi:hypothetical protein